MATGRVHVPRACFLCDRVWLVSTATATWACPHCERATQVVPGESYQATDTELFERVEGAVHARRPSASVSYRLCTSLSDVYARSHRPARLLAPLIDAIPELQFVQSEMARHPARMTRTLGMALIVLTAHVRAAEAHRATLPAADTSRVGG